MRTKRRTPWRRGQRSTTHRQHAAIHERLSRNQPAQGTQDHRAHRERGDLHPNLVSFEWGAFLYHSKGKPVY